MKFWVARDKNGFLYLHGGNPYKEAGNYLNKKRLYLLLDDKLFPELTYDSKPVEVELKVVEKDV